MPCQDDFGDFLRLGPSPAELDQFQDSLSAARPRVFRPAILSPDLQVSRVLRSPTFQPAGEVTPSLLLAKRSGFFALASGLQAPWSAPP